MSALLIFIAYFAIALLSGAAISYPVHAFLSNWFELDFDRVASRCVLIAAIIFFMALYQKLNFSTWRDLGYSTNRKQFFSDLAKGIGFGILIMSPVVIGLLLTKNRVLDTDWEVSSTKIAALILTSLISGLIIGLLEETLFRGAMLSALKKHGSTFLAITVSSLFYALVHFIQPEIELNSDSLSWASGFVLLKNALIGLANLPYIFDSLVALFLAGVLLSIVRLRTNRIALCIGIHAGWVMVIKFFKRVTDSNSFSEYAFLVGSYDKVIGYLAAASIIVFLVMYLALQNQRTQKT